VREGKRAEFEIVFGPDGVWARFLRQSKGYIATEVKSEQGADGRYRVQDFWNGHRDFEIFRARFQDELERFEAWRRSEELIEKEQFFGAYYEKHDDGSEQDLVLS
jgi:hypothetical protein